MVSDIALTTAELSQQVNRTNADTTELNQNFNEFLTLLTAQLQNQDPLDPTDSTEFTNQLVQFSQVEQGINTNQKLDILISNELATATGNALGYVGLDITYSSSELPYDGETPVDLAYFMPSGAISATFNIRDADGNVIYSQAVSTESGRNSLTWDGTTNEGIPVDEGSYSFSIDATDINDDAVQGISTIVTGRVRGVESQNGLTFLLVGDRAVQTSSVLQAAVPKEVVTPDANGENDDSSSDDGGTV